MIDIKTWGEFMFAFWKFVKSHHDGGNWTEIMNDADKIMDQFPQSVFRGIVFGFLEQTSFEDIRRENQ